jgi:hypothetical protein
MAETRLGGSAIFDAELASEVIRQRKRPLDVCSKHASCGGSTASRDAMNAGYPLQSHRTGP